MRMSKSAIAIAALLAAGALASPVFAAGENDGWYARGEIGAAVLAGGEGYWTGPGGGARITFGLDNPWALTGGAAIGYDWMNGIRSDVSFALDGNMDAMADFISASQGPQTGHAEWVKTSVSSQAVMANLFVEPMKAMGHDGPIQPFLTGGLGIAHVSMGEWTRHNSTKLGNDIDRTFNGDSQMNLAFSVGGGVSLALGDVAGGHSAFLDLTYRYSDLGNVSGSVVPTGNGASATEAFNFDYTTQRVTIGLRVPFGGR